MTNVCLYFQVHQPYRVRRYTLFDIGKNSQYFDTEKNKEVLHKVAKKCYIPATRVILDLIKKNPDFKVAYSISGTAIEQFQEHSPETLELFQELSDSDRVEFLNETYYHSLSALYDKDEFSQQVKQHQKIVKKLFGQKPTVFRNTELIYNNEIAKTVQSLGYKAILAEGWDGVLGWRSPNYVYKASGTKLNLLLKNYKLSDDIAFRFSDKKWNGWPLTTEKFASWVAPIPGDSVNLFMDYETFGEHQWADTGIFNFLRHLPSALRKHNIGFSHPSELAAIDAKDELDIHHPLSWADVERDTSAWLGNKMQQSAASTIFKLKNEVLASGNASLIDSWKKLTTSDHFYYMCTKWFNDGDVHKYFSPYETPYEAYIAYMNIVQDIQHQLKMSKPKLFSSFTKYLKEVSA
ncbi:glycoside hydrolase family 57 protein [Candidatus Woesearchaeota archaeon]|nr:glycoside hydrolase family 57 protein [Candidatus Woesearchaeota archaeon]